MAKDISLLGAVYNDVPSVELPKYGGGLASFVDITETTAEENDVLSGKVFYKSNGQQSTGNYISGAVNLKNYLIRPDAEKIETYTYDKYIVADEELTIPAYSTSAQVIKASDSLTPTITLDYATYDYYLLERFLVIPTYNVTTKTKGRCEYFIGSTLYEIGDIPANNFKTLIDGKVYTSRGVQACAMSLNRELYWSSSSAISIGTGSYGTYTAPTAPSISSGVMTVKSPALDVRGSTTYFTSTYFNALTDIRYQFVIDVYRAPKNNLNIDGWGATQQALHILDCVNNNNLKLT